MKTNETTIKKKYRNTSKMFEVLSLVYTFKNTRISWNIKIIEQFFLNMWVRDFLKDMLLFNFVVHFLFQSHVLTSKIMKFDIFYLKLKFQESSWSLINILKQDKHLIKSLENVSVLRISFIKYPLTCVYFYAKHMKQKNMLYLIFVFKKCNKNNFLKKVL